MLNKIEPEARAYLKKVLLTLSLGLTWMFINVVVGLGYEWALVNDGFSTANIVFYLWMVLSLIGLILYLFKLWRRR